MRYFFDVFRCMLIQRLKSVKNWIPMLLIIAVGVVGSALTEQETAAPVTIGVVLPESGGDSLWELLLEHNHGILTFIAADRDTADRNVASGKWDCVLVLAENFEELLREQDLDRIVTVRISSGSTVYPLVQETVSACMAQLVSPYIAWDYMQENGIAVEKSPDQIQARVEEIRAETGQVGVVLKTLDGSQLQVPELEQQGTRAVLYWLICVLILVRMLFGAVDLGKWIALPGTKRLLPLRSAGVTMMAWAGADGFLMALAGCIAVLLLGGAGWGYAAVVCYTLFWMAVSVLFARCPWVQGVLPLCLPFVVVISFLLSSVLLDVSMILPTISGMARLLPVTLFLEISGGNCGAAAVLAGYGIVCVTLVVLTDGQDRPAAVK